MILNDSFLDLCLKKLCPIAAPGHPPRRENMCNLLSEVLHAPRLAACLSFAYNALLRGKKLLAYMLINENSQLIFVRLNALLAILTTKV